MKLPAAIGLLFVVAFLGSCCCPEKAGGGYTNPKGTAVGRTSDSEPRDPGGRTIILGRQNPLPVIPRDQEGLYSCWATSAEMIMEFVGAIRVHQCQQASRPFTFYNCCDSADLLTRDPDCDSPDLPEFGRWGYAYHRQFPNSLSWPLVMAEIDGGRPFAFSRRRAGINIQISHMMVAIGYNEGGGQQVLFCLNPRAFGTTDQMLVPFGDYAGNPSNTSTPNPSGYIHEYDYFGIEPQ